MTLAGAFVVLFDGGTVRRPHWPPLRYFQLDEGELVNDYGAEVTFSAADLGATDWERADRLELAYLPGAR